MPSPWQIEAQTARLSLATFTARVVLDRATPGLEGLSLTGHSRAGRLLALELVHASPAEGIAAYVRQGDLVATFEETPARRVRVQAYWRTAWASLPALLAGVDLEVSVQTSLLDSDPRLEISSLVQPSEIWRLSEAGQWDRLEAPTAASRELDSSTGTGALLFRSGSGEASYFEMTHPADFRAVALAKEGEEVRVTRRLFGQNLEKGVILRSRIRGGFAPRSKDLQVALDAWRSFTESPIPLTT
jgi:hypothetical protein